jgi:Uncharacterised protein family UPF0102
MERMLALRLIEKFVHVSEHLAVRLGRRSTSPAHLELGRRGEEAAFFYLRRRGYTVVARDWRSAKARGDLDLVAWENNILCFGSEDPYQPQRCHGGIGYRRKQDSNASPHGAPIPSRIAG